MNEISSPSPEKKSKDALAEQLCIAAGNNEDASKLALYKFNQEISASYKEQGLNAVKARMPGAQIDNLNSPYGGFELRAECKGKLVEFKSEGGSVFINGKLRRWSSDLGDLIKERAGSAFEKELEGVSDQRQKKGAVDLLKAMSGASAEQFSWASADFLSGPAENLEKIAAKMNRMLGKDTVTIIEAGFLGTPSLRLSTGDGHMVISRFGQIEDGIYQGKSLSNTRYLVLENRPASMYQERFRESLRQQTLDQFAANPEILGIKANKKPASDRLKLLPHSS